MDSSSMIKDPLQFGKWLIVGGIVGSVIVSIFKSLFLLRSVNSLMMRLNNRCRQLSTRKRKTKTNLNWLNRVLWYISVTPSMWLIFDSVVCACEHAESHRSGDINSTCYISRWSTIEIHLGINAVSLNRFTIRYMSISRSSTQSIAWIIILHKSDVLLKEHLFLVRIDKRARNFSAFCSQTILAVVLLLLIDFLRGTQLF